MIKVQTQNPPQKSLNFPLTPHKITEIIDRLNPSERTFELPFKKVNPWEGGFDNKWSE